MYVAVVTVRIVIFEIIAACNLKLSFTIHNSLESHTFSLFH